MADMEFTVARRRAKSLTFTLNVEKGQKVSEEADHVYTFTPPKSAAMLLPLFGMDDALVSDYHMQKATFEWLMKGLSEEDRERLMRRLQDPKDDLDLDTISEVADGLADKVAGRPST